MKRLLLMTWLASLGAPEARAQVPDDLQLVDLGIAPATALALRHAGDGSGRLFIVERAGTIDILDAGGTLLSTPFLDITAKVNTRGEGGLLGLAFHPAFEDNGFFYVYYTDDPVGDNALLTVIERYRVSAEDANLADVDSGEVIFTLDQPATNHNAGDIHFGPDGYLYVPLGDGGQSSATSQDPNDLLGKILRIAPCATPACAEPYTVPASNPNVGQPGPDEIWASGLRNPYRWSFDRLTGDLFIADVGQGDREEVSFQPATSIGGENYGWNCREGDQAGPGNCSGDFVEPIVVYSSSTGSGNCSITGGYRYRGCIAGLRGTYVFADYCSARVWFATEDAPGQWSFDEWANLPGNVFGFGEDEAGELYLSQGGTVYRFESASSCAAPIFADGFE